MKQTSSTPKKKSESKKHHKRRKESFSVYIYRLLKKTTPHFEISRKAMDVMNSFMVDMFEKIASQAALLVSQSRKTTLADRDVETAVRLLLTGGLAQHASIEGANALALYHRSTRSDHQM